MTTLDSLQKEIEVLKERNKRVEMDKKWEASWVRKLLIIVFTYITISFYLMLINISNPWINAVVPAIGFLLSTLTFPFFKDLWTRSQK